MLSEGISVFNGVMTAGHGKTKQNKNSDLCLVGRGYLGPVMSAGGLIFMCHGLRLFLRHLENHWKNLGPHQISVPSGEAVFKEASEIAGRFK